MSAVVTEPNSFSSSPTRAEKVSWTALEPLGERLRGLDALALGGLEAGLLLRDALAVARRRLVGEAAREEIVAGVAGRHLHDVAGLAEVFDRLAKDDFH